MPKPTKKCFVNLKRKHFIEPAKWRVITRVLPFYRGNSQGAKFIYTFASLRFSFAGFWLSTFVLLRHSQTACKRQLCEWSETPKGRCKAIAINNRVSLFPASLDNVKVLCGLRASMDTISFVNAFAELSRKILCKSNRQSTPWTVLAGAAPLDYKIARVSILFLPFTNQFKRFSLHTQKDKTILKPPDKPPDQNKSFAKSFAKKHTFASSGKNAGSHHVVTLAAFVMENP